MTPPKVLFPIDDLTAELDELATTLASMYKLHRLVAHEWKQYKNKYEVILRELKSVGASVVVVDKIESDECAFNMSNITILQTKYATLLDECDNL